MYINKYKLESGDTAIIYSSSVKIEFPDEFNIQLLEENVNPASNENKYYPILEFTQLQMRSIHQMLRTPDKQLSEHGIDNFYDLQNAYFLVKHKQASYSRKIRDLIEQKYADIINNIDIDSISSNNSK